ncbi:MAG: diacylglycerol kinase family protein [Thermosynechococcaceae cyanobacterium MS004]|nr:diacylglycerol kinase family protein [Thermosynechococcaceae cyanobacterium MS004]
MSDKVIYSSSSSTRPVQRPTTRREHSFQISRNLWLSFQYAGAGLKYSFITQRNFRIHALVGTTAISLGLFFQLPPVELALIGLTIGLVMTLELLNTAIEAVVDLVVETQYHELAKIAKDCAAGAVLMSTIASIGVAGCLLLPHFLKLLLASIG